MNASRGAGDADSHRSSFIVHRSSFRRFGFALISCLIIAVIGGTIHMTGPWYKGRTVYHWFAVCESMDLSLRQKSYFAVLQFKDHVRGATEGILCGLDDPDPWVRSQALLAVDEILPTADKLRALPQIEFLLNDQYEIVRDAAKKLAKKIRSNAER